MTTTRAMSTAEKERIIERVWHNVKKRLDVWSTECMYKRNFDDDVTEEYLVEDFIENLRKNS